MKSQIKIAILGDSISEGLGSKKYNYIPALQEELEKYGITPTIKNFARTGTTVEYALDIENEVKNFMPDYTIVFYGNVEAIVRPDLRKNTFITKILPQRYNKIFMLDPRPFYSKNKLKSTIQHLDTCLRYILKRLVILNNGTYRILEPNIFAEKYNQFVQNMVKDGRKILCLSNVRIDDRYFPESSDSMAEYRMIIHRIAEKHNIQYVDLYEWQKQFEWKEIYGNDHFHPNQEGYRQMGKIFAKCIVEGCAINE